MLDKLPDLGLVIDLTNTTRYYHPSNLTIKSRKRVEKRTRNQQQNNEKSDSQSDRERERHNPLPKFAESSSLDQFKQISHIKISTQGHAIPNVKIVKRYTSAYL